MPYISKAEHEGAQWVTLPEAVAHVIAADGCAPDEARRQIRAALNDNVLWPTRWADRVEPPLGSARMQMPNDTPPQAGEWAGAKIDWEAGTVLNEVSEYQIGKWRVLWLDKQSLVQLWPLAAATPDPEEERRVRKWRRERWRRQWIARFAEWQRTARWWIALDELVEWCAHSATTADQAAEDRARDLAWHRLAEAILRGEFEGGGESRVLYLDRYVSEDGSSPRRWLTQEQFAIVMDADAAMVAHFKIAAPPAPSVPINILRCCWLPHDLARQWIERHGYRWPAHFEPIALSLPVSGVDRSTAEEAPKRRAAYVPALADWLACRDITELRKIGAEALAKAFVEHCAAIRPDLVSLLPQRTRTIEPAIERIIERRSKQARRQ